MTISDPASLVLEPGPLNAITDVPGIEVGHYTDGRVRRGTTALLCKGGATGGVSVRGGNPGTIHTDAFAPTTVAETLHGVGFSGGSLFGFSAITGIAEWLLDQRIGLWLRDALIPIVPGAVIYDMDLSDPFVHPTATWGREAATAARGGAFARGNIGAGAGGTAGKGPGCVRTKGGLGTASLALPGGIVVGALVVINSLGGLIHPVTSELYATGGGFDIPLLYRRRDEAEPTPQAPLNTTIGAIATNAALDKPQLAKVADLAHNGFARAIRPMHTMLDGDTIFALRPHDGAIELPGTTGDALTDLIGAAASDAMVLAILDAARETDSIPNWPSVQAARLSIAHVKAMRSKRA